MGGRDTLVSAHLLFLRLRSRWDRPRQLYRPRSSLRPCRGPKCRPLQGRLVAPRPASHRCWSAQHRTSPRRFSQPGGSAAFWKIGQSASFAATAWVRATALQKAGIPCPSLLPLTTSAPTLFVGEFLADPALWSQRSGLAWRKRMLEWRHCPFRELVREIGPVQPPTPPELPGSIKNEQRSLV